MSSRKTDSASPPCSVLILAVLSFLLVGIPPLLTAKEEVALSDRLVEYVIAADLDTEEWTIDCHESILFRNGTKNATSELVFHLYPNAYANSGALHQIGRRHRGFKDRDEAECGYMEIKRVALADGGEFPASPTIDDTILRVPLAAPLEPGESVSLEIGFLVKFPSRILSRSGYIGQHLRAAQWYPKIAVLEDEGWNAPLFYPRAEFYGEFGTFDVTITTPKDYNLEGTGNLISTSVDETGEQRTFNFVAEDVHDFSWVADASAEIPPASSYSNVNVVNVVQPYAASKTEQINRVIEECLKLYSEWYFPYPYDRLVIVGAPHKVSAGMEYPGLIDISFRFPTHFDWLLTNTSAPAGVLIHEFTHQYFYGTVASNEADHPWLDEGLTTYSTIKAKEAILGPGESLPFLRQGERHLLLKMINEGIGIYASPDGSFADSWVGQLNITSLVGFDQSPFCRKGEKTLLGYRIDDLELPGFNVRRDIRVKKEYLPHAASSSALNRTEKFYPGSYHPIAYSKAALSLLTLENHIGRDKMIQVLKNYTEKFRFKHPRPDFFDVVRDVAGHDAADMITKLLSTKGTVDFTVDSVTCHEVVPQRGFTTQKAPGDPVKFEKGRKKTASGKEEQKYAWEVLVRNRGTEAFPVDLELCFENGLTKIHQWKGDEEFLLLRGESDQPLVGAIVDPDKKFALDLNRINNTRTVRHQKREIGFMKNVVRFWGQSYLNGWAFFN